MTDIIISDKEFIYATKMLNGYLDAITDSLFSYRVAVNGLTKRGLSKDMDISKKLKIGLSELTEILPPLQQLKIDLDTNMTNFLKEIDEADEFIY